MAANSFLDAFALFRAGQGAAAQTIDWGALGKSGFVARSNSMNNYLESAGLAAITDSAAIGALEHLQKSDVRSIAFASIDWARLARASTGAAAAPRMQALLDTDTSGGGRIRAEVTAAPRDRWNELLLAFLVDQVAAVLKLERAAVEVTKALTELGFNSLSSIELKNRVEGQLGLSIPVSAFLQTPTLSSLAETIAGSLEDDLRRSAAAAGAGNAPGDADGAKQQESRFTATHEQRALLAAALRTLATDSGRVALQHVTTLRLGVHVDQRALERAFARLLKRHPLLGLAVSKKPSGALSVTLGATPKSALVEDLGQAMSRPLAVDQGEFVRAVFARSRQRDRPRPSRAQRRLRQAWPRNSCW